MTEKERGREGGIDVAWRQLPCNVLGRDRRETWLQESNEGLSWQYRVSCCKVVCVCVCVSQVFLLLRGGYNSSGR